MSEWVRVKDRNPEFRGRYLVFKQMGIHMHNCAAFFYPYPCCEPNFAYYINCGGDGWVWHSFQDTNSPRCEVTHWMEMPEPPTKEKP